MSTSFIVIFLSKYNVVYRTVVHRTIYACFELLSIHEKQIRVQTFFEIEDLQQTGDPHLLTSLLINLIENAIKASSLEGIVEIHLLKDKIIIKDYGIGIKAEELKHIMEPFYMVDKSRSKKLGGAGIGLSLCKAISEKHQIAFYITSEYGKGSEAILEML